MNNAVRHCDLLVIGGGSGGLACARRASSYGATTIIVESKKLGGTCVNVGCVPKKIFWHAASIADTLRQCKHYGFSVQSSDFSWSFFKQKRDAHISGLNKIFEKNLVNDNVEYIYGSARFGAKDTVRVDLSDSPEHHITIKAKKTVIATGGQPLVPKDIPGSNYGITSDGFFELDELPKKVALVGAGYIAVELAGIFNALGSETHLFIRHDTVLRNFDPIIQEAITEELEHSGIHLHKHSVIKSLQKNKAGKIQLLHDNTTKTGIDLDGLDTVLWAIGRTPKVAGLDLSKAEVTQGPKGHIVVDDYQNTSNSQIYALGDVCGKVELTPVAVAAGRKLADRLFGGKATSRMDYTNIPSVVFAHPEIGTIGLTEPQARELYGDEGFKVYNTSFNSLYYSMMDEKRPHKFKLIVQGQEEKVIGMHIIGDGSSEILQGFGVAIKMGATKSDFDRCIAIHPTNAEELVTLK